MSNLETCLAVSSVSFFDELGRPVKEVCLPDDLRDLECFLVRQGVNPADAPRQAGDIRKQLSFDLDFCF